MTPERWNALFVLVVVAVLLPIWIPFLPAAVVAVIAASCTYWITAPEDDQWNEDQLH